MKLHWKIIIGLILGVIWALISSNFGLSQFTINWIGPFGTIFINLLKLIAVPLVLFSIIKGVAELSDIQKLGKIGVKTLGLYLSTTFFAVSIGLILVTSIRPGDYISEELAIKNRLSYEIWANQNDNVQIFDGKDYLNDSKYESYIADVKNSKLDNNLDEKVLSANARKNQSPLQILVDIVPSNIFSALSGKGFMLQIIFFALFFGATMLLIDKNKAEPITKLVDGFNEVFLKMVDLVMKAAPLFVFCLLAGKISEMAGDDPNKVIEIFKGLSSYSLVVVTGLGFMAFLAYPTLAKFLIKKMTFSKFYKAIGKAQAVAFSTSSSAATLPVTMDCVNDNFKVKKEITSFVLPIGATVNMDGTSLYIAIAVVFLAQFHLVDLTIMHYITIALTATLASVGASAVPSAGLIMMIMVLQAIDLNPAWIAIIFPVDRILDMCRTVVNVTGDATVAGIIGESDKE